MWQCNFSCLSVPNLPWIALLVMLEHVFLVSWHNTKRCQQRALEGLCRGNWASLPGSSIHTYSFLRAPVLYRTPSGIHRQQVLVAPSQALSLRVLWVLQVASRWWAQQLPEAWPAFQQEDSYAQSLAHWHLGGGFPPCQSCPLFPWPIAQPSNCGSALAQGNLANFFTTYWVTITTSSARPESHRWALWW